MSRSVQFDHRVSAMRAAAPLIAIVAIVATAAAVFTAWDAMALLPPGAWWPTLVDADPSDPSQLLFRHAFAPRIAMSIIAGAALALSGTILQQVLRNPLAEPATLGTAAGASLALTFATLYAPWLLLGGREGVALVGAGLATGLTFAMISGTGLSPVRLILSGLIVTLVAGSAAATLMALKSDYITELFVWQSGSLIQNGDQAAFRLAWQTLLAILLTAPLVRPLTLLGLDDRAGQSLGLRTARMRMIAVVIAVALAGCVTAATGVIAFIGLASPALVRLAGISTFKGRLIAAPIVGACLLWLTDRIVQALSGPTEIPTGTATALFGAPLLLLLLPLVRATLPTAERVSPTLRTPGHRTIITLAALLVAALIVAVFFTRGQVGWEWLAFGDWEDIMPIRLPRVIAAACAGVLLAIAGTILQRITGNPMASPELLGVSGGAVLGVIVLMAIEPGQLAPASVLAASGVGAVIAVTLILAVSGRRVQAPERLLLSGFAVATLASSLAAMMLASGDPRTQWLQLWLSGSTYRATPTTAITAVVTTLILLSLVPLTARWLTIMPLGAETAQRLGLPVAKARAVLVLFAAIATTVATLLVGPLSFVGLMAPHLARLLGFRMPTAHLLAASAIGFIILLVADWLGRSIIYPWQVPAGLLAALVCAPVFGWLLRRAN